MFGYAHIPSFKKHQRKIAEEALPDSIERHLQSETIAEALADAGYVRIGLDHFALPDDNLALAKREGRLRRNFQGYTDDSADTLIGLGASSIGRVPQGFVQNVVADSRLSSHTWPRTGSPPPRATRSPRKTASAPTSSSGSCATWLWTFPGSHGFHGRDPDIGNRRSVADTEPHRRRRRDDVRRPPLG